MNREPDSPKNQGILYRSVCPKKNPFTSKNYDRFSRSKFIEALDLVAMYIHSGFMGFKTQNKFYQGIVSKVITLGYLSSKKEG
jgi:hypothetical protein